MEARAAVPIGPTLNRLEERYAKHLTLRKAVGEVIAFWPHGITLLLGWDSRYTPDQLVQAADGVLEIHETKPSADGAKIRKGGGKTNDSVAKLRIAASMFPFRAYLAYETGRDVWVVTRVGPADLPLDGPLPKPPTSVPARDLNITTGDAVGPTIRRKVVG
jgi:hypothetical protein